jgi:hypothetical protein
MFDPQHCGACNQPCIGDNFCGGGTCQATLLSNTCSEPVVRAVLDGIVADDDAGTSIAQALVAACAPAPMFAIAGQADAGVIAVNTGEPLELGALLIAGGGDYYQRVVNWLETSGAAHIKDSSSSTQYQYTLRDGGVVSEGLAADVGPHHDIFVVQLSRSSAGELVLSASGFYASGTAAAAWYFINVLLPMRATLADSWYVVEWSDTTMDGLPDVNDAWTPVASGH